MKSAAPDYGCYRDSGIEWLDRVPNHWLSLRLKTVAPQINEQVGPESADGQYIALEHVESWTGRVRLSEDVTFDSQVKRFKANDVLFGKLRPYLAKVTRPSFHGVCVGEFLVLRAKTPLLTPPYLEYLLRSAPVIDVVNASTFGAKMPRANWAFVGNLRLPIPSPEEQDAIVRYLNHMHHRIRRYIVAKQRLIKLVEEQKQAIVQEAVTRGLDPNVRLKPSGVEWLGDIPKHWEVTRSKRLFRVSKELAHPDDVQLSATQAYGVIPQAEFEEKVGRRVVKISLHLDKRKHVERDDFVISMRSFQGGLERAWASGAIRSSYVVLRPTTNVDVDFFSYLLKSPAYIGALQSNAGFIRDGQDLTYDDFCRVDLPLVPLPEQRRIAEAVALETREMSATVARLRREVQLIGEFRNRLIADVVIGKLDVRRIELPDEQFDEQYDEDITDAEIEDDELDEMIEESAEEEGAVAS